MANFDPSRRAGDRRLRSGEGPPANAELGAIAEKPSIRPALARRRSRRGTRRRRALLRRLVAVFALAAIGFLWLGSFWRWEGLMTVTGNRLVSRQEIFSRLFIPQNRPLYSLNPRTISAQLSALPPIEEVVIQRWLFPPRLDVTIVERDAFVAVVNSSQDMTARWIDRAGVVFQAPVARMTPRFSVQVWTNAQPGERIPPKLQAHLLELLAIWPKGLTGRIDLRNEKDIFLSYSNWPVRLGAPEEATLKVAILQELIPLAEPYRERLKYINLRFPLNPTLVLKSGDEVKVEKDSESPRVSPSVKPSEKSPQAR
ncbi:MAG: FtsQ-type POTRA domain-containing protein [Candidatus Sericytochromatia bacterium]|nr:FtsQ-type POTRA domain-containing protein [Candidatus Sericytochromatia bacterium]